jgi:hypothetical protein
MMKLYVYPADDIWIVSLRHEMTFHGKLSRGSALLCPWVAYQTHAKAGAGGVRKISETCKPKWLK